MVTADNIRSFRKSFRKACKIGVGGLVVSAVVMLMTQKQSSKSAIHPLQVQDDEVCVRTMEGHEIRLPTIDGVSVRDLITNRQAELKADLSPRVYEGGFVESSRKDRVQYDKNNIDSALRRFDEDVKKGFKNPGLCLDLNK